MTDSVPIDPAHAPEGPGAWQLVPERVDVERLARVLVPGTVLGVVLIVLDPNLPVAVCVAFLLFIAALVLLFTGPPRAAPHVMSSACARVRGVPYRSGHSTVMLDDGRLEVSTFLPSLRVWATFVAVVLIGMLVITRVPSETDWFSPGQRAWMAAVAFHVAGALLVVRRPCTLFAPVDGMRRLRREGRRVYFSGMLDGRPVDVVLSGRQREILQLLACLQLNGADVEPGRPTTTL